MIASNEKLLLNLIKIALGKNTKCTLPNTLEWNILFDMSMKQCVPSVVLDGLNKSLASEPCQDDKGRLVEMKRHSKLPIIKREDVAIYPFKP